MANKKKKNNKRGEIIGIVLIGISAFIAITVYFGIDSILGNMLKDAVFGFAGIVGYAVPALISTLGVLFIIAQKHSYDPLKLSLVTLCIFFVFSILHIFTLSNAEKLSAAPDYLFFLKASYEIGATDKIGGGLIGALLIYWVYIFTGIIGCYITCIVGLTTCILALTNLSLKEAGAQIGYAVKNTYNDYIKYNSNRQITNRLYIENLEKKMEDSSRKETENQFDLKIQSVNRINDSLSDKIKETEIQTLPQDYDPTRYREVFSDTDIQFSDNENIRRRSNKRKIELAPMPSTAAQETGLNNTANKIKLLPQSRQTKPIPVVSERGAVLPNQYVPPPLNLLTAPQKSECDSYEDLEAGADIIINTLRNFRIQAKIVNITQGPVITRYEIQPAPGVKVKNIVNLADNLAMNLSAKDVRIEAPVPGKPVVGIEVPNFKTSSVLLRELINTEQFKNAKSPLIFAVGKDIAGENIYADIAKMPHLLIAGATGAGKSVCLNSLIISILYHAGPENVKMIMVDPKQVELSAYNGIPHLLIPVVTDPHKAASAINWAVSEMDKRYKDFALRGAKDLAKFNLIQQKDGEPLLPNILVIVDELADLMMVASKEVETSISRITQLGRASGIHMVIATQRPTVNVITGLIKSNIPSRISFAVAQQNDSRTILDMNGAEKLLGHGDMLFFPAGAPKPLRVQGCFISDIEVESVTEFLKERSEVKYETQILDGIERATAGSDGEYNDAVDELFMKALGIIAEAEKASTSILQRRLRIGYSRAARLMDELEERGFISAGEGSKPRQVFITKSDYLKMSSVENSDNNINNNLRDNIT